MTKDEKLQTEIDKTITNINTAIKKVVIPNLVGIVNPILYTI